jgi:hypothetical protein
MRIYWCLRLELLERLFIWQLGFRGIPDQYARRKPYWVPQTKADLGPTPSSAKAQAQRWQDLPARGMNVNSAT